MPTSPTTLMTNALMPALVAVPTQPDARPRSRLRLRSAIASMPASGIASTSHAEVWMLTPAASLRCARTSSVQLPQLVDVDRQTPAVERDDDAEADHHLAG